MGHGDYSFRDRSIRSETLGYATKSVQDLFPQKMIHHDMDPKGVKFRESRDSVDHPMTIPIIVALDVTGSMQRIPHEFVKNGLPTMVSTLKEAGIQDSAILFLAVGDHTCDSAPLQVSQFESSDELLDKWLTSVYIERGGGGNDGESYMLAHYFAGYHTVHDAHEKRGKKGFLFTIGDEPTLKEMSVRDITEIMGDGQYGSLKTVELIKKASELYHVYHLHVAEGSNGSRADVVEGWKNLLGQNCVIVKDHREIPHIISDIITTKSSTEDSPIGTQEETPDEIKPSKSSVKIRL